MTHPSRTRTHPNASSRPTAVRAAYLAAGFAFVVTGLTACSTTPTPAVPVSPSTSPT